MKDDTPQITALDREAAARIVDASVEYPAFLTWWRTTMPGREEPSSASHLFGAWMASARHRTAAERATSPAGDAGGLVPGDHLANIDRAIEHCDDGVADRFGGFIKRTLLQCKHRIGCGTFDDYACDCSAPAVDAGEVERLAKLIETQADCLDHYAVQSGHPAKPVPSVFHLQSAHFRDIAKEMRALAFLPQAGDADVVGEPGA